MKKIITLVLIAALTMLSCFAFASCGNKKGLYDDLTVLESDKFETEEYAVAFRKGSDLATRLNEMFAADFADETVKNVAKTYGLEGSISETFVASTVTGTTEDDYNYIKGKGTLIIGVTEFEGMDVQKDGTWVGFDADMAKKFAESLGVTPVFVEIDWDNKLIDLASKNIDCIWNGMTVTPAITNACEVSGTYMINGQVIVIKKGAFAKDSDLAGKSIAVEGGSAGYYQATENFKDSTVKEVTAQVDALMEVAAGTSDAAIVDYILAKSLLNLD